MPGTVLLLAASPVGRGRLVDAASVLPVLAAVPPAVLAGTDTANVVELADPLEPQAVLTRLRAAAAAPGPLTLFVTGQLQLDRRQRLPHLALARSTPATVRYTGLPWHWLREELRLRPPGTTTLVADLHADPESWQWLGANPLDCGRTTAVYGRVAPPRGRRAVAAPTYMKAVATILRSGSRPALDQLHQAAVTRVTAEGEVGDLLLPQHLVPAQQQWPAQAPAGTVQQPVTAPGGGFPQQPPVPAPGGAPAVPAAPVPTVAAAVPATRASASGAAPDPHTAISAAVQDGRHREADELAARWERQAREAHGDGSDEALHWAEVRADLAMFAGDAERSCRTWLTVAEARLAAGQPADAAAVEAAVDRAHHQWGRIDDPARARELGAALAELRRRVPGRREGALDDVRGRLRDLQTQA
ncbi:hypothetical protein [Streptomyces galbus]|uniref:hypothetical protein n=1 Tax=Streptomyces galbus TaxID=33898 RepID=UPI001581AC6D|nr:hypothetical protein [Streptomyces galbus]GHD39369.1 hypothetical protein GCM10010335_39250 [Streptomyces galbus]